MKKNQLYGFIVVSSDRVLLKIADVSKQQILEDVFSETVAGRDIYKYRRIQATTTTALVQALKGFNQLLKDYAIKDYRAVFSYSLQEAHNANFVKEQVELKTGLLFQWLSESEEHFLYEQIINQQKLPFNGAAVSGKLHIIIEPGNVFLTFYNENNFLFSTTIVLGPLRSNVMFLEVKSRIRHFEQLLAELIFSKLQNLEQLLPPGYTYENIVVVDTTALRLQNMLNTKSKTQTISHLQFHQLYEEVINENDSLLFAKYHLDEETSQELLFTVLFLQQMLQITQQKDVFLLDTELTEGLLIQEKIHQRHAKSFYNEDLVLSAKDLAQRYQSNVEHTDYITKYALQLFDRTKKLHHLGKTERLYLELASILQDIGGYVTTHHHPVHSEYLILSSGLLGLSPKGLAIVAKVARFHSTEQPTNQQLEANLETTKDALIAAKLIALLRIASSLDASHQQRVNKIALSFKSDALTIEAWTKKPLHLETWSFQEKAVFFEEVFGMPLKLKVRISK